MLSTLSNNKVYVAASGDDAGVMTEFKPLITHIYSGNYPAHDAGVLVYHTKRSVSENRPWFIDAQDLLILAELAETVADEVLQSLFRLSGSHRPVKVVQFARVIRKTSFD